MNKFILRTKPAGKKILYCLVGLCLLGATSCSDDYDDAWIKEATEDLGNRVAALEEWQKSVNKDISSLQGLIAALEDKDYVTGITPLGDGSGYVISFLKSGEITIKNGEKGDTGDKGDKGDTGAAPVISAKQDTDGKYYWTVNGEWLLDGTNNKMPVTGEKGDKGDKGDTGDKGDKGDAGKDGVTPHIGDNGNWWIGSNDTEIKAKGEQGVPGTTPRIGDNGNWWIGSTDTGIKAKGENGKDGKDATAPKVRINSKTNEWEISTDGGSTYTSTGVKATGEKGDAFFEKIDNKNPDYVVITLKGGDTIKLPKITGDGIHVAVAGGLEQAVKEAGIDAATATRLKITGTLGDEDFTYLKNNFTSLNRLDLENVDLTILPEYAFENMPFEAVILPKGLTEIQRSAFYSCQSLRALDVPESVETLGRWIVEKCNSLETVTLHNGLKTLSPSTFYGCGINTIYIPRTVTEIPDYCFENCGNLKQIYLHDGINSIGTEAFFNCFALEQFTVPQGVNVLRKMVFYHCSNLNRVNLHEGITSIEESAFDYCSSLRTVYTPEFAPDNSPEQLPKSLRQMGERAFSGTALEIISLGSTQLTEIPAHAFEQCKHSTTAALPASLTKIGESAFSLSNIKDIWIPEHVTEIADQAFNGCNNLSQVICKATTAPTIYTYTFPYTAKTNCSLIYPKDADYSSWKEYFNKSNTTTFPK